MDRRDDGAGVEGLGCAGPNKRLPRRVSAREPGHRRYRLSHAISTLPRALLGGSRCARVGGGDPWPSTRSA